MELHAFAGKVFAHAIEGKASSIQDLKEVVTNFVVQESFGSTVTPKDSKLVKDLYEMPANLWNKLEDEMIYYGLSTKTEKDMEAIYLTISLTSLPKGFIANATVEWRSNSDKVKSGYAMACWHIDSTDSKNPTTIRIPVLTNNEGVAVAIKVIEFNNIHSVGC